MSSDKSSTSFPRLVPIEGAYPVAPIYVSHGGNRYKVGLSEWVPSDFQGPVGVQFRLEPITVTLNGKAGVPVEEVTASGLRPHALTWGHEAFRSSRKEGDFLVVTESGLPHDARTLNLLLDRVDWTNRLSLASGATHCGRLCMDVKTMLMQGCHSTGIGFYHRGVEKAGDYLRLGFIPYDTLVLESERCLSEADPELRAVIESDVKALQAKAGLPFAISTSGQTVLLGSKMLKQPLVSSDEVAAPMRKKSPIDSVVLKLEAARARSAAGVISPLEFSREREALLAEGLNEIAEECGIKLQGPLHLNSRGEFPIYVENPEGSHCGAYGEQFAALLARHGIRFGQQECNHASPTNGWGWMNHFAAERMVLAYHAEAGESIDNNALLPTSTGKAKQV